MMKTGKRAAPASKLLLVVAAMVLMLSRCTYGSPTDAAIKHQQAGLVPGRFLVQLRSDPLPDIQDKQALREAALANKAAVCDCSAKVQQKLREAGVQFEKVEELGIMFHGFSLSLPKWADTDKVVELLMAMEDVISVKPVATINRLNMPEHPADDIMPQGLFDSWNSGAKRQGLTEMTGVDWAHKQGLTGAGIKVGVIDSGIDHRHPAFGSCYKTSGCKIVAGYDFVGDKYNAVGTSADELVPYPDDDPGISDCPLVGDGGESHGTHVAGIIAANATMDMPEPRPIMPFTGVAPGVELGVYRVFGCGDAPTSFDVMMAAVERAYEDGMDIVNLSIGASNYNWPYYAEVSIYTEVAEKLGMMVVISAGNDGDLGIWYSGLPANSRSVFSVAASAPTIGQYITMALSDGSSISTSFSPSTLAAPQPGTSYAGMQFWAPAAALANTSAAPFNGIMDGCDPDSFDSDEVQGRMVLIAWPGGGSNCSLATRIDNAARAGAGAVMIGRMINGDNSMLPYEWESNISAIRLQAAEFQPLLDKLADSSESLSIQSVDSWPLAFFTSFGPDAEMRMKPTIAAPGTLIYSTWRVDEADSKPLNGQLPGYYAAQGTSMAAPYVAGALALYMEAKGLRRSPSLKPADLMATFITTAAAVPNWSPGRPAASVLRTGAGQMQLDRAIQNQVQVSPDHLILKTTVTSQTVTIKLRNTGRTPVSYTLGHTPAMSYQARGLYSPDWYSVPEQSIEAANVAFAIRGVSATKVAINVNRDIVLQVTISAPDALFNDRWFYSGYITLTPGEGSAGVPLSVPYLGYTQDFSSIPALAEMEDSFAMANSTFSMSEPGAVFFTYAIQRPVKKMSVQVYDASSDAWLGTFDHFPHTERTWHGYMDAVYLNKLKYRAQPSGRLVPFEVGRQYYLVLDMIPSIAVSDAAPVKLTANNYPKSMAAAVMQRYTFKEYPFTFTA